MFKRKKNTNRYHNYILVSERDTSVKQLHFSQKRLLSLAGISVVVISGILFMSADAITGLLYKAKMQDLQANYENLSVKLLELKTQLDHANKQMENIEEKDQAIRTYAGLPQIDQDIRKLGVGGAFEKTKSYEGESENVFDKISEIELNVDALSRRVKLELSSYNSLADEVESYSNEMKLIPSIRPVREGYLGSGYGYREDPFTGKVRFHYGQDFAVNTGTKIYAPADGKVKFAQNQGGYGKVVKIDHENGFRTIYAHLSKIKVKYGQNVQRGDLIAISGNTGRSAGPHLHYEVHKYGSPQNPLDYFFSGYLK